MMYICKAHEVLDCAKGKGRLCCAACSEECEYRGKIDGEPVKYGARADCEYCEEEGEE